MNSISQNAFPHEALCEEVPTIPVRQFGSRIARGVALDARFLRSAMATGSSGGALYLVPVQEAAADFPLVEGFRPRYGTAGFRGSAEHFTPVAFRAGVVAALRSYATGGDCGLVITASHNPPSDNGVKFVDFNGEMIPAEWEVYAEEIVNAATPEALVKACESICERESIRRVQRADSEGLQVFVGHDSRPSSPELLKAATRAIKAMQLEVAFEAGEQTTPQVHFISTRVSERVTGGHSSRYITGCGGGIRE